MIVSILGVDYTLEVKDKSEDPMLKKCDGYCDPTVHKLVVASVKSKVGNVANTDAYVRQCKRHEIIHAFLYESGLGADWEHKQYGHEETAVDWLARQAPKMMKAFIDADAI